VHHFTISVSSMDWILERTVHRGLAGASLGDESFSDLDYADDVALLTDRAYDVRGEGGKLPPLAARGGGICRVREEHEISLV